MLRVDGGQRQSQVGQVHGQGAVQQTRTGDNPLEGHTAAIGERGPSVGDRFKSFFTAIGHGIAAFGRALAGIPAAIGGLFAGRRQNAGQAEGPGQTGGHAPSARAQGREAALHDPDLALLDKPGQGTIQGDVLTRFMGRHLDTLASPAFWDHGYAKMNAEHFGCGLALAAVDRMVAKGTIDEADRELFGRMASGGDTTARPAMPDAFLGPVTEQSKDWMAQQLFQSFGRPTAELPLNMDGATADDLRARMTAGGATADDKLGALKTTYSTVMSSQYIGHNNLRSPLQGIPD